MLDGKHDPARLRAEKPGDSFGAPEAGQSPDALNALLAELLTQHGDLPLTALLSSSSQTGEQPIIAVNGQRNAPQSAEDALVAALGGSVDAMIDALVSETRQASKPAEIDIAGAAGPAPSPEIELSQEVPTTFPADEMPTRIYSPNDLMLFERLTGYRLVPQRQLWRAVDKHGDRASSQDRLFTVLAEEAFQMADRHRRSGPTPQADLTAHDIATAMTPLRKIAAQLGGRGDLAFERLQAVVGASTGRRAA